VAERLGLEPRRPFLDNTLAGCRLTNSPHLSEQTLIGLADTDRTCALLVRSQVLFQTELRRDMIWRKERDSPARDTGPLDHKLSRPCGPSRFEYAPFSRSGILPLIWRPLTASNRQPSVLETDALPIELRGHGGCGKNRTCDGRLIKTVLYQLSYTTKTWRRDRDSNPGAASLRPSAFQAAPIDLSGISPLMGCLRVAAAFTPGATQIPAARFLPCAVGLGPARPVFRDRKTGGNRLVPTCNRFRDPTVFKTVPGAGRDRLP
jgi:hypothetical protein